LPDEDFADKILNDISYSNVKVIPEKIAPESDESLESVIREDIDDIVVLPIISVASLEREWAKDEIWRLMENKRVDIFPIIRNDKELDSLERKFSERASEILRAHTYFSFDSDENKYRNEIVKLLRAVSPRIDPDVVYSSIQARGSRNPFRRVRTEHFGDLQLLAEMFAEPESPRYERIIEVKPTIIQGGRGCGKSMVLRSMEAMVVAYRNPGAKSFKDLKVDYFGVYCRLSQGSFATQECNILDHVSKDVASRLFSSEMVLQLTQSLIEEIKACMSKDVLRIDLTEENQLIWSITQQLQIVEKCVNLEALTCAIQSQLQIINDYLSRRIMGENQTFVGKFLTKVQLKEICKAVLRTFPDLANTTVYFLLDEYENLQPFQKVAMNTLVKWSESGAFTIKIGTKKTGFKNGSTTEGQEIEEPADYTLVDLDYDLSKKSSRTDYFDLLKKICGNVLQHDGIDTPIDELLQSGSSAPGVQKEEIENEVRRIAENIRNVKWSQIPAHEQTEYLKKFRIAAVYRVLWPRRRQYSGFNDLAFLSSGIIRYFLELCGMSYHFAAQRGVDIRKGGIIDPMYQSEAVYTLSNYYLSNVKKNIPEFGSEIYQLVIDIGDIFHFRLRYHPSSPEGARLSIIDPANLSSPFNTHVDEIINQAVLRSVLQSPTYGLGGIRPTSYTQAQPEDLILNRIYAPALRYSPRARWGTNFTVEDLSGLLDKKKRGNIKSEIIRRTCGVRYKDHSLDYEKGQMKLFQEARR